MAVTSGTLKFVKDWGGTNQSKDFVVQADPQKYQAYSIEVIEKANKLLVNRAAQDR